MNHHSEYSVESPRSMRAWESSVRKAKKALPKGYGLLEIVISDDDDWALRFVFLLAIRGQQEFRQISYNMYEIRFFPLPKRSLQFVEGRRWKKCRRVECD